MSSESQVSARLSSPFELLYGPRLRSLRIARDLARRKTLEQDVVSRMTRDELPLQMRRQLGESNAGSIQNTQDLLAIVLAFSSGLEIEKSLVPGGNLNSHKA